MEVSKSSVAEIIEENSICCMIMLVEFGESIVNCGGLLLDNSKLIVEDSSSSVLTSRVWIGYPIEAASTISETSDFSLPDASAVNVKILIDGDWPLTNEVILEPSE